MLFRDGFLRSQRGIGKSLQTRKETAFSFDALSRSFGGQAYPIHRKGKIILRFSILSSLSSDAVPPPAISLS